MEGASYVAGPGSAEWLRTVVEASGFPQAELARLIGINKTSLNGMVTGRSGGMIGRLRVALKIVDLERERRERFDAVIGSDGEVQDVDDQ